MLVRSPIDRRKRLFSNAMARGSLVSLIGFGVVIVWASVELIFR